MTNFQGLLIIENNIQRWVWLNFQIPEKKDRVFKRASKSYYAHLGFLSLENLIEKDVLGKFKTV